MSREHARPQPPAGSRRHGGAQGEPAPVPVGVRGHRPPNPVPSGPGPKLDPPEHTQPVLAPPWTQGANGGQYFVQLAWLISQLPAPSSQLPAAASASAARSIQRPHPPPARTPPIANREGISAPHPRGICSLVFLSSKTRLPEQGGVAARSTEGGVRCAGFQVPSLRCQAASG
jgi:hypothetical protein